MKFFRKKYFVFIVLVLLIVGIGAYLQISHPWRKTPTLQKFDLSDYYLKKPTPTPLKMSEFPTMNMSMSYPANVKLTQINSQLISLSSPLTKADQTNTLYIYSEVVPANTDKFKVPFTIPGSLKHSSMIKLHGFIANQETYSDGTNELNLLVLRKGNQTIVIKIPQNSQALGDTITDVVNSIQTLN